MHPMFIALLFINTTMTKIWKQSKFPSTGKWIKKMWCIYIDSGILFSLKKEGNSAICDNMDETGGHHAEWNKPDTEKQWCHVHVESRGKKVKITETK